MNSFQAVFSNYDFDFVKNSYNGARLQVFDWNIVAARHAHLAHRARYDQYQSLLATLHRIIRYARRGFTFSCDDKFMTKMMEWAPLSKHVKKAAAILTGLQASPSS